MAFNLSEYLSTQFYFWEQRGRGWQIFPQPVHLEPTFIPFFGHIPPISSTPADSGRRSIFFPSLIEKLGLSKKKSSFNSEEELLKQLEELYPIEAYLYEDRLPISELQINFNKETRVLFDSIEQLLLMIATSDGILGFEIFGQNNETCIQFICPSTFKDVIKSYISIYAPGVNITENSIQTKLDFDNPMYVIELGLRDEFMRPFRVWNKFDPDPLTGCIASLESIVNGEFGMFQVLFQRTLNPWAESIYKAVSDGKGGPFFENSPEMLPLAKEKISSPLFAVVIRAIGQAESEERAHEISKNISLSLTSFQRTGSNSLLPLPGEISCTPEDILSRSSRRIGMLLNSNELASIVHIPDRTVISPKLRAYTGKTKKVPNEFIGHPFELGRNLHLGSEITISLTDQHRLRHMHVIGGTGSGKTSLLQKLIVQDISQGRGVAVLDAHGDLIEEILTQIPKERLQDVVLVDPSDSEFPVGLNLLSAHTDAEKTILASDLVALFRRFATSWGDQMTSVLANAITAILESAEGGTLIDLRRMLVEPSFRNKFLQTVSDPNIQYYWKNEFQLLRANAVAPILTRLDTFLRPRIVRNMMAQKEGLDFTDILNSQKIFLVKLAQGLIGEENSYLLGTLIVAKLHQAAQSRQNLFPEQRKPFYFYIDEFQNFITPSMSSILSGARKYGLGLILAHQDLEQLFRRDSELANSVLSNPFIRVCFRCGDKDALKLQDGFSFFEANDLQNLGIGHAIARIGQKDHDFNLSFELLPKVNGEIAETRKQAIVEFCRSTYAIPESEVNELLNTALLRSNETFKSNPTKNPKIDDIPTPKKISETPIQPTNHHGSNTELITKAQAFVNKEVFREKQKDHRFIQEFVKSIGEARNFKVTFEEPVNEKSGKVDVCLLQDDLRIACEISVTNSIEYEVHNIQKCLEARFSLVFMISEDGNHLEAIRSLVLLKIDSSDLNRVFFVSKNEFVEHLDLMLAQRIKPAETRAKGYRVKVNYSTSPEDQQQRKALKDSILNTIRKKG